MKAVVDTMLWVSFCTFKKGRRARAIQKAKRQRVRFFVSQFILDELEGVLISDLRLARRFAHLAMKAVLRVAKKVSLSVPQSGFVPRDPNDDPIIQTALEAKADFLVTADKEILSIRHVQDVRIITLEEFEEFLEPK